MFKFYNVQSESLPHVCGKRGKQSGAQDSTVCTIFDISIGVHDAQKPHSFVNNFKNRYFWSIYCVKNQDR